MTVTAGNPLGRPGTVFRSFWEGAHGSVSLAVVYACTALYLGIVLLGALGVVSRNEAMSFLGLSYAGVFHRHLYYQLATAPFLHADIQHLLFNMLSLWLMGPSVENSLGRRRYILFSILCALASMVASLLVTWGTSTITVGYSGVIFGILVAQAVLFPDALCLLYFFPVKMRYAALILGIIELCMLLSPDDRSSQGIAHGAHLAGAVVAFLYLRWLRRPRFPRYRSRASVAPPVRPPPRDRVEVPREL